MPFLFREIVFCECGRPALAGSSECRTCYEDAVRREWREERRIVNSLGTPEPVKVSKPRLREKRGGEVAIPAYEAMQENGIGARMLEVLMRGVSTRQYAEVLPEMASSCGVSKSKVSREVAEAGEKALQELLERRLEDIDRLVIYRTAGTTGHPITVPHHPYAIRCYEALLEFALERHQARPVFDAESVAALTSVLLENLYNDNPLVTGPAKGSVQVN